MNTLTRHTASYFLLAVVLIAGSVLLYHRVTARPANVGRVSLDTLSTDGDQVPNNKPEGPDIVPAQESQEAVAAIQRMGGTVTMTTAGDVTAVNLTGCELDGDILRHLSATPRITLLNLDGTSVTDGDLRHIHDLPDLRYLRLSRTNISDDGLKQLHTLPNVVSIHLSETRITDAGIRNLSGLPKLSFIEAMGSAMSSHAQLLANKQWEKCRVKL